MQSGPPDGVKVSKVAEIDAGVLVSNLSVSANIAIDFSA